MDSNGKCLKTSLVKIKMIQYNWNKNITICKEENQNNKVRLKINQLQ